MYNFPLSTQVLIQISRRNLLLVNDDTADVGGVWRFLAVHGLFGQFNDSLFLLFLLVLIYISNHHVHLLLLNYILSAFYPVYKFVDQILDTLGFETVRTVCKPGVVCVLRSEVLVTLVALDRIKKRFQIIFLCVHLLNEILAIFDGISVG